MSDVGSEIGERHYRLLLPLLPQPFGDLLGLFDGGLCRRHFPSLAK